MEPTPRASMSGVGWVLLVVCGCVAMPRASFGQVCPSSASCNAVVGSVVIPSGQTSAFSRVVHGEQESPDGVYPDEMIALTYNRSWDQFLGSARDDFTQPVTWLGLESYWNGNAELNIDIAPGNSNSYERPLGFSAAYDGSNAQLAIGGDPYSSGGGGVVMRGGVNIYGAFVSVTDREKGSASDEMLEASGQTDVAPRFALRADGSVAWGSGSRTVDVSLFRSAAKTLNTDGNLVVGGNLEVIGQKAALVTTASYGKREVYAIESPAEWFEDFGSARLVDAQAVVRVDPVFGETVNTDREYHVFLTSNGRCSLFVADKERTFFRVKRLTGSRGCAFDYRIVAKRKGYEKVRLAQILDVGASQGGKKVNSSEKRLTGLSNSEISTGQPVSTRPGVQER
jgi:hypothetical protein